MHYVRLQNTVRGIGAIQIFLWVMLKSVGNHFSLALSFSLSLKGIYHNPIILIRIKTILWIFDVSL